MIDNFLYAKLPPHLKRSFNLAYLVNGRYDQIVAHLERELEHSGLENDGQLPIPTMTVTATKNNANKPDLSTTSCICCKKLGHLFKDCRKKNPEGTRRETRSYSNQKVKGFKPKTYSPCFVRKKLSKNKPSTRKILERSQCSQQTTKL